MAVAWALALAAAGAHSAVCSGSQRCTRGCTALGEWMEQHPPRAHAALAAAAVVTSQNNHQCNNIRECVAVDHPAQDAAASRLRGPRSTNPPLGKQVSRRQRRQQPVSGPTTDVDANVPTRTTKRRTTTTQPATSANIEGDSVTVSCHLSRLRARIQTDTGRPG